MLKGKKVLLGVCASIAAYKAALIVRSLIKEGAEVQVVMTPAAKEFITPLTLATLSKSPVPIDYFNKESGEWNNHVELGLWADIMLIAPASANTIAKLAGGICDNLLTAVYLSARCPVYFAPAMDLDMWAHPSTQQNIKTLQSAGNILIAPESGELASGLHGDGRLAEPEHIVSFLNEAVRSKLKLNGYKVLVTAGPTYEAIDPVRFIGNHSSGKMGFAIAEELAQLGADVTLISGPTALTTEYKNIKRINVTSAQEMLTVCTDNFAKADACIMSAAVADYTPASPSAQKIKKKDAELNIALKPTVDIIKKLGQLKKDGQVLVGFALETNDEEQNAISKLQNKNMDMIVLNSLNNAGAGFATDTNKVTIIDKSLQKTVYPLKSKTDTAKDICAKLIELIQA
ncbi:bifunctional phosphopantothenoylcysteine decarboxylase/phosphopantothenate--cysteine ligase CoaBC [Mucilaginibacter ginkgonis]|uniref:Coenzyme A biosynthesis bifunctional protein CoaBC n=1 Tax=Mucilaginibacter ginkgonis TaxID=2682091 RepID=A0A6I4IPK0_9SPHI|nr:bifunctional phosphopantothenoylcysteine decarboxylase/phosphopantothenate--cysteine ligase CoaBC [Mucilaginibacter ginkgonis]QQL49234.1 bifunctional phosphopantothenoylcysteine decarboxylase/phosphopantothenate--cysteine ligase CoaBC [Mucilaginibacter ginkgonis]